MRDAVCFLGSMEMVVAASPALSIVYAARSRAKSRSPYRVAMENNQKCRIYTRDVSNSFCGLRSSTQRRYREGNDHFLRALVWKAFVAGMATTSWDQVRMPTWLCQDLRRRWGLQLSPALGLPGCVHPGSVRHTARLVLGKLSTSLKLRNTASLARSSHHTPP